MKHFFNRTSSPLNHSFIRGWFAPIQHCPLLKMIKQRIIYQRLEPCMQEHLFSHFSMAGYDGFLSDVPITFIEKADPSDLLRRKDYWRQTLKTMFPYGFNVEDSVWWVFLLFYMVTSGFIHGNVGMFLGFWFRNNGVDFCRSILSLVLLFLYYHCCR